MSGPLARTWRARYAECDQQRVVFNAHYLTWFDDNMTELWRAAFGTYQAAVERGLEIVVAEAQMRFRASARFDDELEITVAVAHLGTTSIHTRHQVLRDGDQLVEGSLRHVAVDPSTLGKIPIPDWARAALAPWTIAEPPKPAAAGSAAG
jgi:acyl-CoA thioester hydrolase